MTFPACLPAHFIPAVQSAGYRVVRWAGARQVLHARVFKGRVMGDLGEFLARWMPMAPLDSTGDAFGLALETSPERICLCGGDMTLLSVPAEHALLHLPALRSFWRNELRQEHFEALKALVPPAWFMDDRKVPPGSVIHGLGITDLDKLNEQNGGEWEVNDGVLARKRDFRAQIMANYARDDRGRVVLRSIEAVP